MPIQNGKKTTAFPGLLVKSKDKFKDAVVQFDNVNTAPTTATGYYYLYVDSGVLKFDNGSTTYNLLTTAGGGISSWDGLYASDTTLTINGSSLTFNGTHASNDVLTITGAGTGAAIQITNSSTGADISGTSATWSVSAAGVAVLTAITGCDTLTAAANMAIDATGAGTITLAGTSTGAIVLTTAVTATTSITITGSADTDVFTITNGDVAISAGQITITEDDTTTYALNITSSGTTGGAMYVTANDLANGYAVIIDSDNSASFGTGGFFSCYDGTSTVFSIARYGAVTIAGTAEGTDSLTLTKGDLKLTDGALVITAGAFTYTAGDMTMSDGSLAITDADNAATFSVTNDTATTASVIALAGSGVFTGTTTASWMTITPSGLTTGTGVYAVGAGLTQGKLMHLTTDATMTSGTILYVQNTGADSACTSGTVATFDHTATQIASAVNKTGSVVSITSNRTVNTGGTTADDFDLLSVVKATTRTAGTAATAGSALYVEVQTTGTVTETSNGIELVMDSGGTGAGIKVTHAATGGIAGYFIGAATTVDDVLISSTGAKADNKAALQVTNSGNTAAGGSLLRVASGASTPAAATSYLVDFDYSASTMTNNPVTVIINSGSSTGAALNITGSGAGYSLATYMTGTGATGVQWFTEHTSTGSAADNDVVFTLHMAGLDDANATNTYGKIICTAIDVSAGTEDGKLDFQVSVGGTSTSLLYLQSSNAGATTLVSAAAASTFAGSAAGTAALTVTNGDISLSAGKFISTTTADIYGLDITVNKATATQGVAVLTNASATSGKAVLELEQADLDQPYLKFSGATKITSATAGANGGVPAQVDGYFPADHNGTAVRIPYYLA
jgi:hypothetical protein